MRTPGNTSARTTLREHLRDALRIKAQDRLMTAARAQGGSKPWFVADRKLSRMTVLSGLIRLAIHVLLVVGALGGRESSEGGAWSWFSFGILALLLTGAMPCERLTERNDFDRLHLPSYPALLLFRCLNLLPLHLAIGVCWASIVFLLHPFGAWTCVLAAAVFLAPSYLTLQWHVREALFERVPVVRRTWLFPLTHLPAVLILIQVPILHDFEVRPLLSVLLLVWFAVGIPWALRYIMRHPQGSEEESETESFDADSFVVTEEDASFPERHAGRRSLLGNAWYANWARLRPQMRAMRRSPIVAVSLLFGIAVGLLSASVGAAAIWRAEDSPSVFLALLAALFSVTVVPVEERQLYYFLGTDFREVVRHNLKCRMLIGLGPAIVSAIVCMFVVSIATPGVSESGAAEFRLATLAMIVGFGLWRATWFGLWREQSHIAISGGAALLVGIILAALVGVPVEVAYTLAAITGAFGMAGVVRQLVATEADLRRAWRMEEE